MSYTQADLDRIKGRRAAAPPADQKPGQKMNHPEGQRGARALGRLPAGEMNKTEAAYARHLEGQKITGDVLRFWFEELKFKIGTPACWYSPDFVVQMKSGALEIHEVKGHWEDDALVKVKAVALRHPYRVIAVRLVKATWEVREFN